MSSEEQTTDESLLSVYRINHRLVQSKLLILAEHQRTKKVYRTEIDQDAINTVTQGVCDKCEQLFDLLQELIHNDGKTNSATLQLQEEDTKLILNVTFVVVFGQTSREFQMKFELESVQLDDITRLESIIQDQAERLQQLEWSAHDRFDRASKLVSLWKNDFHFRNVTTDHAILSDNDRTMHCHSQKHQEQHQHATHTLTFGMASSLTRTLETTTGKQAIVTTNRGFFSKSKRYQVVRFDVHVSGPIDETDTFLVGVISEPNTKQWSTPPSSAGTWAFDVCNGSIQYPSGDTRPYTCSLKKLHTIHHVEILLDTHHRCLAFRIDDQTEDQWAFCLPKQLQIDQLYPFILLNSMNVSVSIAQ